MGFISANIGKLLGAVAGVALMCFLSFEWGKAECEANYERAGRKIAVAHAVVVVAATDATADLAIDDNNKDSDNDTKVNKIIAEAELEPDAGDLCWSDGFVDELRELQ